MSKRCGAAGRPACLFAIALIAACGTPPDRPASVVAALPEVATGLTAKPGWSSRTFAVAAANPLAAEAGAQMLRDGGSAIDAAVAVQMVLALVEPQSSGLGGGAMLLHWDGQRVQAFDGRETAPALADERLFLAADGQAMPLRERVQSGRAVGVPGAVRMLEAAHRQHGRLPWARLFEPAIRLSEQGFPISPRLFELLRRDPALRSDAQAGPFFYPSGAEPWPVGHRLRNPALASVLRAIANEGSRGLHEGTVATDIVARVRSHRSPGSLSLADLQGYRAKTREAICTDWKAAWRVCGFPPPSSGHLTMMQILGMLELTPKIDRPLVDGVPSAEWLHVYTEAARLAFADRDLYIADPDFVAAPGGDWRTMLATPYLKQRAALITARSVGVARPGQPGLQATALAPQPAQAEHGTSHISIVDSQGHALAMTTTIEDAFGARIMSDGGSGLAGGFLLNNQLTDFAALPADAQGRLVGNRVQPGKRPRSSMSPTLVFDRRSEGQVGHDARLAMSLGSSGGAAIIHFTAKTLVGSLDWGLDAQRAVDLPNFGSFNGPTVLESRRFPPATIEALRGRGHSVVEMELTSGLQAIQRRSHAGWFGAADPRREGVVVGD